MEQKTDSAKAASSLLATLQQETRFLSTWTQGDKQTLYELFKAHGVCFPEGERVVEKPSWCTAEEALKESYEYLLGKRHEWSDEENKLVETIMQIVDKGERQ